MKHGVFGKEELKEFIREEGYSPIILYTYPDVFTIVKTTYLKSLLKFKPFFLICKEHKKEVDYLREERWALMIKDAAEIAEMLERVLKRRYGMSEEKEVILAEAYPAVEYAWKVKKKEKRSGKYIYFARKVQKIIGVHQGALIILVPREFKEIARSLLGELKE